jgi:signal transduction histidine kinase
VAFLCYALLVGAWIVDLFTPQLFIAAILYNGPIALSSLALNRRLTTSLVVVSELLNVVAGYTNGLPHHLWQGIAIADRVLAGLSFVLVGYLALQTQQSARRAGAASLRSQQARRQRLLAQAVERLRASLNLELVFRAIVRESVALAGATRGLLVIRSGFETPQTLSYDAKVPDVAYERKTLSTELATLVERARQHDVVVVDGNDALGRMTLAALGAGAAVAVSLRAAEQEPPVLVLSAESPLSDDALDALRHFCDQAAVALEQAKLFTSLGEKNDEIARQRDEIARRGTIIRDIVYALAHDLRTPLAAADVTMKQALAGAYGELPERYRDVLSITIESNEEERRLLETLLLVARYESGEASLVREPVDCNELTRRVVAEIEPVAHARGVAIAAQTDARGATVRGDPGELRRAVANLAANAVAATPAGGRVVVESAAQNRHVRLSVSDDGYGVPEPSRANLFERFAARGPGGGTGLGLYIVRKIAEKHGGSVAYAPREPHGSAFTITLERGA